MRMFSVYAGYMARLRKFVGHVFRIASEILLNEEKPPKEEWHVLRVEKEDALKEAEPTEPPARPRKAYNMGEHKTYYVIGYSLLKALADEVGPKSVKDLVELTDEGFAQSSVRQIAKEMVRKGFLTQASDFPATFTLSQRLRTSQEALQDAFDLFSRREG